MLKVPRQSLPLEWLEPRFEIVRFPPETEISSAILNQETVFFARTPEEVSVLCEASIDLVGDSTHGPLRGFRVVGPMDFAWVGIVATLTRVLADAEISVITVSTFDTDYVFVDATAVERATGALKQAGFAFVNSRKDHSDP
jgi:hypothetical protein